MRWVIWDQRPSRGAPQGRLYVELPLARTKRDADRELWALLRPYASTDPWRVRLTTRLVETVGSRPGGRGKTRNRKNSNAAKQDARVHFQP